MLGLPTETMEDVEGIADTAQRIVDLYYKNENKDVYKRQELETLPGIGEKKALTIVEYREANGPFRAVEELERVKGISERTVDGMRAYVRVS